MATELKIQIRSNIKEKSLFQAAAALLGFKSVSEFMRVAAHEKSRRECPDLYEAYKKMMKKNNENNNIP